LAELISGIDLMPQGRKRSTLFEAVEGMIAQDFRGQVLKFDVQAAHFYGEIFAYRQQIGRPVKEMDALIAATAQANGAALATRNTADFEHCGIALVNPWLAD
jgi:toxin FitB